MKAILGLIALSLSLGVSAPIFADGAKPVTSPKVKDAKDDVSVDVIGSRGTLTFLRITDRTNRVICYVDDAYGSTPERPNNEVMQCLKY